MGGNHRRSMVLLWLLLSTLLAVLLHVIGQGQVRNAVALHLEGHLLQALDEAYFSSSKNRVTDGEALQRLGRQINTALTGMVQTRWYAPVRACTVALQSIDGVQVGTAAGNVSLQLPRNHIQREVNAAVSCSPNPLLAVICAGLLGLLFWLLDRHLPAPLTGWQAQWLGYLTRRGYSWEAARAQLGEFDSARLHLNSLQLEALEQLHVPERDNFTSALRVLGDARVAQMDAVQMSWLLLGLTRHPDEPERAIALAQTAESLIIDLPQMRLQIRGEIVPMSGTPLFYYAWYALGRSAADGWLTNPASNRPDLVAGRELAALMERHGGHARAINDLENVGLKAKTLDQNRSKIKEELVTALGEELAAHYLFETERHPDGVHMRYRLRLPTEHIQVKT